jgi:peptidoglycan-associated lipoprotein
MKLTKYLYLGLIAVGVALSGCSSTDDGMDTTGKHGTGGPGGLGADSNDPFGPGGFGKSGQGLKGGGLDDWERLNWKFPSVYFAYDKFDIGTAEKAKLDQVANYLNQHPEVCVIIEGNCDERGSAEYNRGLGERRALAVQKYLASAKISDDRFKTISFGSERPAVEGHNEAAWSKNRRDDLVPAKKKQ